MPPLETLDSKLLNPPVEADENESAGTKLLREAELLWDGTKRGVTEGVKHAWNNPGETLTKFGVSAVIGGGLALMQGRAGMMRVGAQVLGLAFGYSFATDVLGRGRVTLNAMGDTWRSSANLERNKEIVAGTVGPFVVDVGIMTAGGLTGARVARIQAVYNGFHRGLDRLQGTTAFERHNQLMEQLRLHHPESAQHSERVGQLAELTAKEMKLPPGSQELARHGGRMHDIGKVDTPLAVLDKPGKLTDAEYAVMKQHAEHTLTRLEPIEYPRRLKDTPFVASAHHEKVDGSGYFKGLKGEQIPIETKVISVADVFDATSSARGYRGDRMPIGKVYELMLEGRGTAFDPRALDAFFRLPADRVVPIMFQGRQLPASEFRGFDGIRLGELMRSFTPGATTTVPSSVQSHFARLYGIASGS